MNYSVLVMGAVIILSITYYLAIASKFYRGLLVENDT